MFSCRKADRYISTHSLTRRLTIIGAYNASTGKISTHSLTRRLTDEFVLKAVEKGISTHSLTRRLTHAIHGRHGDTGNFNSQPHKEADDIIKLDALR